VATILMIFLRINQTLSFWTAHSASRTAQNWLDCTARTKNIDSRAALARMRPAKHCKKLRVTAGGRQAGALMRHEEATENARPDIARLDNAAPYRKGGHRETCFSVRVDAH